MATATVVVAVPGKTREAKRVVRLWCVRVVCGGVCALVLLLVLLMCAVCAWCVHGVCVCACCVCVCVQVCVRVCVSVSG